MKKSRGFTLVELMIVMAVIAILATLALVGFRTAQRTARNTEREQVVRGLQVALECYFGDNGIYPAGLTCATPAGGVGAGCWPNAPASNPTDPLGGAFCSGAGLDCAYSQPGGVDTYQILLTGEGGRVFTFLSPT